MPQAARPLTERALVVLARDGLLLESDGSLPSVSGLLVGGPIRGSWWAHPKAAEIYNTAQHLSERSDVLVTKLISGKVTYIHRRLWPALLSAATSRESWQLTSLSETDSMLLELVDKLQEVRTDQVQAILGLGGRKVSDSSRALERVLLVHGEEVHTASGAHAKRLETWTRWVEATKFADALPSVAEAKITIEASLASLNKRWGGRGRLPWPSADLSLDR